MIDGQKRMIRSGGERDEKTQDEPNSWDFHD